MKLLKKSLIAILVAGVLTGTALTALADNVKGKPFEGFAVEGAVTMEHFPNEVDNGSILFKDDSKQAMVAKARLNSNEAADIARKALPGTVVEAKLDNENGYLIWEVEVLSDKGQEAQLKIDAGNGYLLAIGVSEDDEHEGAEDDDHENRDKEKHSSWKFWEDNDQDEQHEDRD